MRRPHVYERSAPRSVRNSYHEPVAGPDAAVREIATSLAGLLSKADGLGLSSLAGLIRAALNEAQGAAPAEKVASPDAILGETHAAIVTEAERIIRVRDMSKVLTQPKASNPSDCDTIASRPILTTMLADLDSI